MVAQTTPPLPHETELLKFFFGLLEEAEVLVESEGLTQLKEDYSITGGAARPALSSGQGRVDQNELWARFPWLQVRAPLVLLDNSNITPCVA